MFDSHCHLDFAEFDGDRRERLARARDAGIENWFVPGCYAEQWGRVRALGSEPGVLVGLGVHPWWAGEVGDLDSTLAELARGLADSRAVALGECGLDQLRASVVPLDQQVRVFEGQLALGLELGLPLVLHQVRAREPFLRSLDRVGLSAAGAVVHGFSGDTGWARVLTARGLRLGVGPALLRLQRERLRAAVTAVPLDLLLVETDAPDQGLAGQRGAPLDLLAVVEGLAGLRGLDPAEVGRETARNARGFFGQPVASGA